MPAELFPRSTLCESNPLKVVVAPDGSQVGRLQLATEFLSEGPNRGFEPDTCSLDSV